MKNNYWTGTEWITALKSNPCDTCEKSRQAFLDLVKDMDGVTVINGKKGVKLIEVRTEYKLYRYEVHAETIQVKVGEKLLTRDDDGFEGTAVLNVYKEMYIGRVYKNTYNAYI